MKISNNSTKKIKYLIAKIIPESLWNVMARLMRRRRRYQYQEKKRIRNNKKPIYYVIRRTPPGAGLFSNVNHVAQGIIYALENDFVPVVDQLNYWTWYSENKPIMGNRNAWEYFFNQPSGQKVTSKLFNDHNYVLSKGDRILGKEHWMNDLGLNFVTDKYKIEFLHGIYSKYIQLNDFSLTGISEIESYIDFNCNNTLGIFYRGTEYSLTRPKGHARQPEHDDILLKIEKKIEEIPNINRLFLATEDKELRYKIQDRYKSMVYRDFRSEKTNHFSEEIKTTMKSTKNLKHTLEYIIETEILSKCDYVIASVANGSCTARIRGISKNKQFEFIQLGSY